MIIRTRQLLIGTLTVLVVAGCSVPTLPTLELRAGFNATGLGYGSGHEAGAATTAGGEATAADSTTVERGGLGYGSGH